MSVYAVIIDILICSVCIGYDMSTYIRCYAKYLNEKAFSYRQMAFDFCKVKRGFVQSLSCLSF